MIRFPDSALRASRSRLFVKIATLVLVTTLLDCNTTAPDPGAIDAVAVSPMTANSLLVSWQDELTADDRATGDNLGAAVSVSGDTAVVSASTQGGSTGATYVFVRSGTSWSQQAKLTTPDGAAGDTFGGAVSLSGDTAVIGAPGKDSWAGAAYVFVRSGASWSQQAKLTVDDAAAFDELGESASVSGNTAVVGAPGKAGFAGGAYVFVRSGTSWSPQATLSADDLVANDLFGLSADSSGDTAIVGAPGTNSWAGAAYVFTRTGSSWSPPVKLALADAAAGDGFGLSVGISGDTVIVGAQRRDSGIGAAYVFVRDGTDWSQPAKLSPSDGVADAGFGGWGSVSVAGSTAVVGASAQDGTGAAYVFVLSGPTWSQQAKLTASDTAADDRLGTWVSTWSDTVVIGAPGKAGNIGAAYAFVVKKALGDTCSSGVECDSTHCVDSVCCDSDGCSAIDQCHDPGVCVPQTGTCSNPAKPDDSLCSDDSVCTLNDTCQSGVCVPSADVTCEALDQCHTVGACDSSTGVCSNPPKADGSACDDGSLCTRADFCQTGACLGFEAVICAASDACHATGTCDTTTGVCSNPAVADDSPCAGGLCQAGTCVHANPNTEAGKGEPSSGCGCGAGSHVPSTSLVLLALAGLSRASRRTRGR